MRAVPVTIFILTFFFPASSLLAAADPPAVQKIYAGALPEGWTLEGWGGCELTERKEAAGEAKGFLALTPQENATPWCGGTVATPTLSAAIPDPVALPSESFGRAFLVFKLNGLADEFDRPSSGQTLQVSIGEKIKDTGPWPECWQNGGYVDVHGFLKGDAIDNDPDTWQEVRIPLRMLTDAKKLRFLGRIAFQFIGAPPSAGVAITDIAVEVLTE
jgi:hypothetical protein